MKVLTQPDLQHRTGYKQNRYKQKLGPAAPSLSDLWGPAGMQGGLFSAKCRILMQQGSWYKKDLAILEQVQLTVTRMRRVLEHLTYICKAVERLA